MTEDHSDLKRNIQNHELESATYLRHLNFSLVAGAAAGIVALLSFSAGRQNATSVLISLAPSYVAFLISLMFAGAAIFSKSRAEVKFAEHLASSHNREELNAAIRKLPVIISSPQRIADEANLDRNNLIAKSKLTHERAENSWWWHRFYVFLYAFSFSLSFLAFMVGAVWPLLYVFFGGEIPV